MIEVFNLDGPGGLDEPWFTLTEEAAEADPPDAYQQHREQLLAQIRTAARTYQCPDYDEMVEQFRRLHRPGVSPTPTCPGCGSRVQHHTVTLCQHCREARS